MIIKWKRVWNNKTYNFEVNYLLSAKLNSSNLIVTKEYLEDPDLQDQIKSTYESFILDKIKKSQETKVENEKNDERTKVRNHFRNICFRKKFQTLRDHIKYISNYYSLPETTIFQYIEDDLEIIKKQTMLK